MKRQRGLYKRGKYWYYRIPRSKDQRISLWESDYSKAAAKLETDEIQDQIARKLGKPTKISSSPISFGVAIEIYLKHKKVNSKKATYENDRKRLNLIKNYIGDIFLHEISEEKINEFKSIRKDEVSETTLRGDLICLRALFNYFIKKKQIVDYPFENISIKQLKPKVEYLTVSEVYKLLSHDFKDNPWMLNFFKIALSTGFRRGELATLKWKNIDFEKHKIVAYGKTGEIEFPTDGYLELEILLQQMYETEKTSATNENRKVSEYVFHQDKSPLKPYHEDKLSQFTREVFDNIGLNKKYSLHTLRHTFGTHLYKQGVPLEKIQLLMGHSSIETTLIYAHVAVSGKDVAEALPYKKYIFRPFSKTM
jgi:site-specific recombinase XerD